MTPAPYLESGALKGKGFELRSAIVYQSSAEAERSVAGSRNVRGLRVNVVHRWIKCKRVSIPVWIALVFEKTERSETK